DLQHPAAEHATAYPQGGAAALQAHRRRAVPSGGSIVRAVVRRGRLHHPPGGGGDEVLHHQRRGGEVHLQRAGHGRGARDHAPGQVGVLRRARPPQERAQSRQRDRGRLRGPLQPILEREAEKRGQVGELIVGPAKAKGPSVSLSDLVKVKTLGTGTFGRVKLVQHRKTKQVFAMKCMQKAHIAKSHQSRNIMNEKNILMACDHAFILDLLCTYNTTNELLMLTELLLGGELWSYIYERATPIPKSGLGGFSLSVASFFCGCVVLPLQYLHQMSVAYRDLKPENLLLGQDGYLKVIDFGFAKRIPFKKDNTLQTKSFTLCGTPDYLAPELVLSRGHDKAVDYWALGCFLYELLCGRTPFTDPRQAEIFKKAIRSERFLAFPAGFPATAQDLIRRLLTPNATYRLGNLSGGIQDIMSHPMFNEVDFNWRELYAKRMTPPHKPK
ncbi:unnamed protein product, partial [Ectocarpus fasciculatus]